VTRLLAEGRASNASVTILLPTFNRAEPLRETLAALSAVDYSGIDWEIVVIDNNSSDHTPEVVKSFQGHLPICYLRETRPGKNSALNKALRECSLKHIVVFTDDDVTPDRDWLKQIVQISARWPDIAIFGGRVDVRWPGERPEWASTDWIQAIGFSQHDLGDREVFYDARACPFGPNYWVRKEVFRTVSEFDENLGPRPANRLMGGETVFLLELQSRGFEALYSPLARVQHRIAPQECCISALRRRGYRFGRAQARLHGWTREETHRKSAVLWAAVILADYVYTTCRLLCGLVQRTPRANCEWTVDAMIRFGRLNETVGLFWRQPRSHPVSGERGQLACGENGVRRER
jgi:glycosyltransferase involved in cell wall biosynthesis